MALNKETETLSTFIVSIDYSYSIIMAIYLPTLYDFLLDIDQKIPLTYCISCVGGITGYASVS